MTIAEEFQQLAKRRFEGGFETKLRGTRAMVEDAVINVAHGLRLQGFRLSAERGKYRSGQPIVSIRAESIESTGGGSIGVLLFVEAPGGVIWMRIPDHRGSPAENAWSPDNSGSVFAEFLSQLMVEFERLGFKSASPTGESASLITAARQQLASAEGSEAVVGAANILRSALIRIANEAYDPKMRPEDAEEPKGDDATTKLRYFVYFRLSNVSPTYRTALVNTIESVWELVSSLLHRKNPTKSDGESAVALVEAVGFAVAQLDKES